MTKANQKMKLQRTDGRVTGVVITMSLLQTCSDSLLDALLSVKDVREVDGSSMVYDSVEITIELPDNMVEQDLQSYLNAKLAEIKVVKDLHA